MTKHTSMENALVERILTHKALPDQPSEVELVSTHISWVLLTPEFAYKIKKPVHFSFLDFSTLEKRKFFCEQELILNQRLAPQIYLDVVEIRQNGRDIFLGDGEGTVIDFAVSMKRLDNTQQMNLLLEAEAVDPVDLVPLAGQIAAFHRAQPALSGVTDLNEWRHTFNDLDAIRPIVSAWGMTDTAQLIRRGLQCSDRFLEQHGPRLLEREHEGWIIEGHGDLHARNIFLTTPPVVFDCIEFSKELRQLDVLNEIAFFCMDMDAFKRPDLGSVFLQIYLDQVPCMPKPEDRLVFDYFKLYRANVRLKVNGLQGNQADTEADLRKWKEQIRRYSVLFHAYLSKLEHVI